MRKIIGLLLIFAISNNSLAQNKSIDSLTKALSKNVTEDTNKVNLLLELGRLQFNSNNEYSINYSKEAQKLAQKLNYGKGEAYALKNIGIVYYLEGKQVDALLIYEQSLKLFEKLHNLEGQSNLLSNLGSIYYGQKDDETALSYYLKSLDLATQIGNKIRMVTAMANIGAIYSFKKANYDKAIKYYLDALNLVDRKDYNITETLTLNLGEIYLNKGQEDSALFYFQKALKATEVSNDTTNIPYVLNDIGKVYEKRKDFKTAISFHSRAYKIASVINSKIDLAQSVNGLANASFIGGRTNSALAYYKEAASISKKDNNTKYALLKAYTGLANIYSKKSDFKSAFKYQQLITDLNDSLHKMDLDKAALQLKFKQETIKKSLENNFNEQYQSLQLKQKLEKTNLQFRNKQNMYVLISGLLILLIVAAGLWRINIFRKKSFAKLQQEKQNTDAQKMKVEQAFENLKSTQKQLIQSEKMASLGELTAGIAHEIQNPLNFVNNFSDVNQELLVEMKEEMKKGNLGEADSIANDVIENEQKINHHGKRADAIVKGMLQHSRTSTGVKEPTDINALADEYLRLSYHGLRAKDKSFNAEMKTDFDRSIGKINIIPQDIGRVLLNLFNNAFYAVSERQKAEVKKLNTESHYEPTVSVTTKKSENRVTITVSDNGNGIPQKIVDKIFQPFFTTKPTGEGTGLGLSLAYDIVKAHGGELKVKSKEGEGTEFIIQLPIKIT